MISFFTLQMDYLFAQPWFTVLVVTVFLARQSSAQDFATLALRARSRADADTRFAGGTYTPIQYTVIFHSRKNDNF